MANVLRLKEMRARWLLPFCVAIGMMASLLSTAFVQAASGVNGSPPILNLYLDWQMPEEDLARLARWDVVVLDVDQQARYPERIQRLRALNPKIKILAYIASEEISEARFSEPADYPMAKMASAIQDEWYAKDPQGKLTQFWPETRLFDVTDRGVVGQTGERWNEFLPRFIHNEVLSTGLWDGIFFDNAFDGISRNAKSPVDLDRDGTADDSVVADRAWQAGMKKMFRRMRELDPQAILVGNGGETYADQLNGVMFERFPSLSWEASWEGFRSALALNPKPSFTALNVNTKNEDRPDAYQLMRFGLANALIGGGWYSFDKGDAGHDMLWWYDEYSVPLGAPTGEAAPVTKKPKGSVAPGVWSRPFERGLVLMNSLPTAMHVPLPEPYEKIRGTQDVLTNDGGLVVSVALAAQDGLVLQRPLKTSDIVGVPFTNGSFLRALRMTGEPLRNGFFAKRPDVGGGANVLVEDMDQDGKEDVLVAEEGVLTISSPGRPTRTIRPFGEAYVGAMSVAILHTSLGVPSKIVVSREENGSDVQVFSFEGKLLMKWVAFPQPAGLSLGGARVAVGDLDGDGNEEIVAAGSIGTAPTVRIWHADGTPSDTAFSAFPSDEIGGVALGIGDVDGDGQNEIIAGSGEGALPSVKIFDGDGLLRTRFSLGSHPASRGLRLTVVDADHDGTDDILVDNGSAF